MKEKDNNYRISAVDRALLVLEALGERPNQGVTSLASSLGLTKSIVFRLLFTLEQRGFVVRDPERAVYALGHRMSVLGERVSYEAGLLTAARSAMERLRDITSENVNLIVRNGQRALVLATREGHHAIRLFAQAGRHAPLHAGGGSLLLLAYAPPAAQSAVLSGPLERYTPYTMTDPADITARLEKILAEGCHITANDLDEGAFSVAVPVHDASGAVIASLSVAGAEARLTPQRQESYLAAVREAAEDISRKLALGAEVVRAAS